MPLVSVIVPTYHRPALLRRAVASVQAQGLSAWELEIVVAVSDPRTAEDVAAARELAEADARVVVAESTGHGAGATRNAGLHAARGEVLAFLDDDCEAQPGWLAAGLAALDSADLVQGRTTPPSRPQRWDRYIWITSLSYVWECCNLFARRSFVDAAGGFDVVSSPTGRLDRPFGEDAVFGWRVVRAGARPAYCDAAHVHHIVEAADLRDWLRRRSYIRFFPLLLRQAPEVRGRYPMGVFLNRHHAALGGSAAALAGAALLGLGGARGASRAASGLAAAVYLSRYRRVRSLEGLAGALRSLPLDAAIDAYEVGLLLYGSARWRRLLV